ncbi:hypothetical protein E4U43_004585 [Claviceps pusilla]|uniref:Uncharacterized protein n=1 Tax=Claviceps pusilla TaxID=123648 RepID=A0A9P7SWX7_9HYPO|nr:hypothetical protein E4U43_004585 [Claviceps pusilla]
MEGPGAKPQAKDSTGGMAKLVSRESAFDEAVGTHTKKDWCLALSSRGSSLWSPGLHLWEANRPTTANDGHERSRWTVQAVSPTRGGLKAKTQELWALWGCAPSHGRQSIIDQTGRSINGWKRQQQGREEQPAANKTPNDKNGSLPADDPNPILGIHDQCGKIDGGYLPNQTTKLSMSPSHSVFSSNGRRGSGSACMWHLTPSVEPTNGDGEELRS